MDGEIKCSHKRENAKCVSKWEIKKYEMINKMLKMTLNVLLTSYLLLTSYSLLNLKFFKKRE